MSYVLCAVAGIVWVVGAIALARRDDRRRHPLAWKLRRITKAMRKLTPALQSMASESERTSEAFRKIGAQLARGNYAAITAVMPRQFGASYQAKRNGDGTWTETIT